MEEVTDKLEPQKLFSVVFLVEFHPQGKCLLIDSIPYVCYFDNSRLLHVSSRICHLMTSICWPPAIDRGTLKRRSVLGLDPHIREVSLIDSIPYVCVTLTIQGYCM